jgi:hypothetical protein
MIGDGSASTKIPGSSAQKRGAFQLQNASKGKNFYLWAKPERSVKKPIDKVSWIDYHSFLNVTQGNGFPGS